MCARCVNHKNVILTFLLRALSQHGLPFILFMRGEITGRGQLGRLRIAPPVVEVRTRRYRTSWLEAGQCSRLCHRHPAVAVRMSIGLHPAPLAPQRPGCERASQLALHVRAPPGMFCPSWTPPSMGRMPSQTPQQVHDRLATERPSGFGRGAPFCSEIFCDAPTPVPGLRQAPHTITEWGGITAMCTPTHGTCCATRCRSPPPGPCNGPLDALAAAFTRPKNPLAQVAHHRFAVGHRRGWGRPKRGNVVRPRLDGVSLRAGQYWRWGRQKALGILLALSLGRALLFPRCGQLPCDQARRRLHHTIVTRSALTFVRRPLEPLLPPLIECLTLLFHPRGRFHSQGERRGRKRSEPPWRHNGVHGCTRQILAIRPPVVGGDRATRLALHVRRTAGAHEHATMARATAP
jgi:hypothetical protein